jgi:hypothetical protein
LPNAGFGVHIGSSDNLAPPAGPGQPNEPAASGNIVGLNPNTSFGGLGNLIAFNGGDGVQVDGSTGQNNAIQAENSGNSILGNSIYSNGGLGIDLKTATVAGIQPPNNLLAAPTITAVVPGPSSAVVQGIVHLPSSPGTALRIELFSSPTCDAGGFGEGQTLIGSTTATTDVSGNASFSATTANVGPGQSVTATATNTSPDPSTPPGSVKLFDTSQFSGCSILPFPPPASSILPISAPAPSNAFTVISKSAKNGVITVKVQTHAAGALVARSTFVTTVSGHGPQRHPVKVRKTILYGVANGSTAGGALATLTIKPTVGAAALLKRLRQLKVTIKVTFTPTGGTPNTAGVPLTVIRAKPKTRPGPHH